MELFLNFIWVLLFLPAWWMWQRNQRSLSSVRCFLSLGCALVLLFPVISATDDLHAASQAMEESSSTKRTLKHANFSKVQSGVFGPAALIFAVFGAPGFEDVRLCARNVAPVFPKTKASGILANRAPPLRSLTHFS